jgi:hypothetical protein
VDSPGSGYGPVVGCSEHCDEPSGSGATEFVLVSKYKHGQTLNKLGDVSSTKCLLLFN